MKNRVLLTLVCILGVAQFAHAETKAPALKIGYVNINNILSVMPETKISEGDYDIFEQQVRKNLAKKVEDFQVKLQAFQKGYETMSEATRQQKEEELKQLQMSLQQMELDIHESLNNKHMELLKPIYEKVQRAVKSVAQENGYTHIFNSELSGLAILLYTDEKYDISELVLKKLGVSIPKKASKQTEKK
jgi:outer membrane protein